MNFTCSKWSSSISHAKPILLWTYLLLLIITWIFQSPICQTVLPFPFPTFNYLPSCLGLLCLTHLFFLSSCKVRTLILVSVISCQGFQSLPQSTWLMIKSFYGQIWSLHSTTQTFSMTPHNSRVKSGTQGCHNIPTAYFLRFISNYFLKIFLYSNQIGVFTDALSQPILFCLHATTFMLSLPGILFPV